MKKLLSILLALIFCLGMIVSCKDGNGNENDDLGKNGKRVDYFYHLVIPLESNEGFEEKCKWIVDYESFEEFIDALPLKSTTSSSIYFSIDEEEFNNTYVLAIPRKKEADTNLMGYRNFTQIEEGCSIICDKIWYHSGSSYEDGKVQYYIASGAGSFNSAVYYDIVVIPKNKIDFTINLNTEISVDSIIHPSGRYQ